MVSDAQLNRAIAAAKLRETEGYFAKAKAGDQKAASLFVRLVAFDLNPGRDTTDYGWLSKQPGESQVDGWAEDAIVLGINPTDLTNVVDLVNGAGAPGASIGGAVKARRLGNQWAAPQPLTAEEMAYLAPVVPPPPPAPSYPYPDENTTGKAFQARVKATYTEAKRAFPDPNDPDAFRHFMRYGFSCHEMPEPQASDKHIAELRAALGLPV